MANVAIDVFCGVGGLSYGFRQEGFKVAAGIDSDASCRYAFERNVRGQFLSVDITRVSSASIKRIFKEAGAKRRILIGCAPCTPFSLYSGKYRKQGQPNARWQLLREFQRLATSLRPDVISMENVPRLERHPIFRTFVDELRRAGYSVSCGVLRADHFGVPQRRSRLVMLASRLGPIDLPKPRIRRRATVRDAIGKLPPLKAGERDSRDPLHFTRGLSDINLQRLRSTTEGGGWQDWNPDLQLDCHKKRSGKSFRSVYGRMKWDAASPVITTQCLGIGNGRFGHPEQDRAISVREAALLQSFPKAFRFLAPGSSPVGETLARQIGNAVPVKLGRAIARSIRHHLDEHV